MLVRYTEVDIAKIISRLECLRAAGVDVQSGLQKVRSIGQDVKNSLIRLEVEYEQAVKNVPEEKPK